MNDIYRLAKAREWITKDLSNVPKMCKRKDQKILINEKNIKRKQKEYFRALFYEEFPRKN